MEQEKLSTLLKPILFLLIMIGGLCTPISVFGQQGYTDSSSLVLPDTSEAKLINMLFAINDPYLCFLETLRAYNEESSLHEKFELARISLLLAGRAGETEKATKLIQLFANDFRTSPELLSRLKISLLDIYLLSGRPDFAENILQTIPERTDSMRIRRSYYYLLDNDLTGSYRELSGVRSSRFVSDSAFSEIMDFYKFPPAVPHRSPVMGGILSAVLPGAGQAYSDHVFDALNAFGFNFVLSGAAYAGWKYQSTTDHSFIFLPVVTTVAAVFFYVTNVWGGVEAAERFNNYNQSLIYNGVIRKYKGLLLR